MSRYKEWNQDYVTPNGQYSITLDASFRVPINNALYLRARGYRVVDGHSEPGTVGLCLDKDGVEWFANQLLDWLRRTSMAEVEWRQKEEGKNEMEMGNDQTNG